jgi:hypothetical protein
LVKSLTPLIGEVEQNMLTAAAGSEGTQSIIVDRWEEPLLQLFLQQSFQHFGGAAQETHRPVVLV